MYGAQITNEFPGTIMIKDHCPPVLQDGEDKQQQNTPADMKGLTSSYQPSLPYSAKLCNDQAKT